MNSPTEEIIQDSLNGKTFRRIKIIAWGRQISYRRGGRFAGHRIAFSGQSPVSDRGLGMIASLEGTPMRTLIFSLILLAFSTTIVAAQQYDLVFEGGRVMDPETGLDGLRNQGIRDGKIARISSDSLSGRRVIHASGLVVAPGFIDLHQHGQDLESQRVKAGRRWQDRS